MKALYVMQNGRIIAEDVSPNCRLIEEPDGLHPIQPDNIYKSDSQNIATWGPDDSICVVFQGFTAPETFGEGLTKDFIERQLKDDFILKTHLVKQSASKVFWRRLVNYLTTGAMLILAVGIIGITVALLYAVARVVLG